MTRSVSSPTGTVPVRIEVFTLNPNVSIVHRSTIDIHAAYDKRFGKIMEGSPSESSGNIDTVPWAACNIQTASASAKLREPHACAKHVYKGNIWQFREILLKIDITMVSPSISMFQVSSFMSSNTSSIFCLRNPDHLEVLDLHPVAQLIIQIVVAVSQVMCVLWSSPNQYLCWYMDASYQNSKALLLFSRRRHLSQPVGYPTVE